MANTLLEIHTGETGWCLFSQVGLPGLSGVVSALKLGAVFPQLYLSTVALIPQASIKVSSEYKTA